MLISGSPVNPEELFHAAWKTVESLLVLQENESAFLTSVQTGTLRPELLFPHNADLAQRIGSHPALLWKISNAAARPGRP